MDAAAIAGLCAVLAQGRAAGPLPEGLVCPPVAAAAAPVSRAVSDQVARAVAGPEARDAIARVTYAEAGNQGDSGLAAVVYAILNRLADGRWGASIDQVLNAHAQFEPVMRAGGDWRDLPPVRPDQQARIDTILNLALDGRLPDLTNGARYFQNPVIVARRARDGQVSPRLIDFGGATPSAIIGAHRFYTGPGREGRAAPAPRGPQTRSSDTVLFAADGQPVEGPAPADTAPTQDAPAGASGVREGDPAQALFVGHDGSVSDGGR